MMRRLAGCLALWAGAVVAAEPQPMHELLLGGQYQVELKIVEPTETWPVVLKWRLDDTGRLLSSMVDYPTEGCGGQIARMHREGNGVVIAERITRNPALCAPGRYAIRFGPGSLYQLNRPIVGIHFSLDGETYPGRVARWQFKPSVEARWRLKHRDGGWLVLRKHPDLEKLWPYVLSTAGGQFYPEAVRVLAQLLVQKGDTAQMRRFLTQVRQPPRAVESKVESALYALGKKHHDWTSLTFLARWDVRWREKVDRLARKWAEQGMTLADALGWWRCCASKEAEQALIQTISASQDWDGLFAISGKSLPEAVRQALYQQLLSLADAQPERLWRMVMKIEDEPAQSEALARLVKLGPRAGWQAHSVWLADHLRLWRSAWQKFMRERGAEGGQWASALQAITPLPTQLRYRAAAVVLASHKERWDLDRLNTVQGRALLASLQPVSARWSSNRDPEAPRLILEITPAHTSRPRWKLASPLSQQACKRVASRTEDRTRTLTAFLIIPVGTQKVRYRVDDYVCQVAMTTGRQALAALGLPPPPQTLRFSVDRKLAVLETRPNAIGKAMVEDARAPGKCKALRESCLARCEGMSNKRNGLFLLSDSDRDRCRNRCFAAFHACASGQ